MKLKKTKDAMTYEAWFEELKRVAVSEFQFTEKAAQTLNGAKRDFQSYYEDGSTPSEALAEDLSYAM